MATKKLSKELRELSPNIDASRRAWDAVMRQGVIAAIHIGRYRFEQRLTLEDLGVASRNSKETHALEQMVKTGVKLLLPPEYDRAFRSIESSARHTLSRSASAPGQGRVFAFQTPFGPFIPVTAFQDWKEKIDEYRQRYEAQRDDLLQNYADIGKRVLSDYYSIATGTYERLRRFNPEILDGLSASTFVRRYRDRIREGFPTKEVVAESFYFKTNLTLLVLPEDLRERIASTTILDEEEKARVRQLQFMKNEVSKSMMDDLRTFTATVDEQLYELLYKVAEDASKAATENKVMRSKTLVQLRNLVHQVRSLNFTEHQDLADVCDAIEESVSNYAVRAPSPLNPNARKALTDTLDTARVLAERRLAAIGTFHKKRRDLTPEDGSPWVDIARRARRALSSDDESAPSEPMRRRQRIMVG